MPTLLFLVCPRRRYRWNDVIHGEIKATDLARPLVQIDLALLKVECINGRMFTHTVFYETVLDSRKEGDENLPFDGA